ncbi:carbohydrate ABC transporter permease [Brachybacterium endophyticum]|uniref:carbohydrate ABC transporter permease n=1 Tax=Brachybacterium endophyticum TaxID=2182385 RepID=UPI00196AF5D9|nr:sugar ABC transporter permease [Brachybacterium endophyticum]
MSAATSTGAAPRTGRATRKAPDRTRPTRIRGTGIAFWLFFTPFAVGLLIFTIVPLLWGGALSFFEAKGTVLPSQFVGFANFSDFLTDTAFLYSLRTFTIFALFIVPVTMASSLFLAVLVNGIPRFQAFYRSVFFLPTACSYVVASVVWRLALFNGLDSGVVNRMLSGIGLDSIADWLSASPYWWVVLISVRLWMQVGFYMLLFLAGLQAIPSQLYEAAAVDGLNPGGWRMFRSITLPQLRTTSTAVLLLLLIAAFQAFDEFYNLTGNNPETRPPLVYLYNIALGPEQDFGHGSAGALVLTAIMVLAGLLQTWIIGFDSNDDTRRRRLPWRRRTPAVLPAGAAAATTGGGAASGAVTAAGVLAATSADLAGSGSAGGADDGAVETGGAPAAPDIIRPNEGDR